jgi:hypothetical protein
VIFFEGTLHVVTNVVEDSSGGIHFKRLFRIQAQGVGLDSGAKYVWTSAENEHVTSDIDAESATTFTQTFHGNIIRQGEDGAEEDVRAQLVIHFTQNATGELTAEVLTAKAECQ